MQFYQYLRSQILLGEYEPGSRLPTIEEMAEQYNIANHSVRRALELLDKEDFIIKRSGFGVYIRNDLNLAVHTASSIKAGQIIDELLQGYPKVLSQEWVIPPKRIMRIFGGQENVYRDGKVFTVRLLLIYKSPKENRRITNVYIPENYIDDLIGSVLQGAYFHQLSTKDYKYKILTRPWICNLETAELLELTEGTPVFHRTWIVSEADGRVFWISEGLSTASLIVQEE